MKKFIHSLIFVSIVVIFIFCIIMPQYRFGYNAAILDKYERLKLLEGPKIIIAGNSSLAFGINSKLIEDYFNMPVVNLGLHGSVGESFEYNMALQYTNKNDIVIIAPTKYYKNNSAVFDPVVRWLTIENNLNLLSFVELEHMPKMINEFPTYFKRAIKLWLSNTGNKKIYDDVYSRFAFNEYGDLEFERVTTKENIMTDYVTKSYGLRVANIDTEFWREYGEKFAAKGAYLVMAGYPILKENFLLTEEQLYELQYNLNNNLGIPFISNIRDYIFSVEDHYNLPVHLTSKAAIRRTEQLIQDLDKWMASTSYKAY